MPDAPRTVVDLTAVILAVTREVPRVLVTLPFDASTRAFDRPGSLPSGPFDPGRHRTLEAGLRQWLEARTGLAPRYIEQLYTFGNQYRDPREISDGPRVLTVAYLALSHELPVSGSAAAEWRDCYAFLPWEDWRGGRPRVVDQVIRPCLDRWSAASADARTRRSRAERSGFLFGPAGTARVDELVLERYELLYEAGLIVEAARDRDLRQPTEPDEVPPLDPPLTAADSLGPALSLDNRRILAAALGRVRGKLAYRPVVFELLPAEFTLYRLQSVVEALAGVRLHKQNFRRMVISGQIVETAGRTELAGRGRPAALYRFRREVVWTKAVVGIGLPHSRTG